MSLGVGIHATRRRHAQAIAEAGLHRPGSAYFVLGGGLADRTAELRATLPVALYFALSLRTVGHWLGDEGSAGSYRDWYSARPGELPVVLLFEAEPPPPAGGHDDVWTRYLSWATREPSLTAPYRKVGDRPVQAERFRFGAIDVTLEDLEHAERLLAERPSPSVFDARAMPKPFFAKQNGGAAPSRPVDPAPALAANVPGLCLSLAELLEPRLAARLETSDASR